MLNPIHCHKTPVHQIPTVQKINGEVLCQPSDHHLVFPNMVSWGTQGLSATKKYFSYGVNIFTHSKQEYEEEKLSEISLPRPILLGLGKMN